MLLNACSQRTQRGKSHQGASFFFPLNTRVQLSLKSYHYLTVVVPGLSFPYCDCRTDRPGSYGCGQATLLKHSGDLDPLHQNL
jgi:hypothetical protein